MPPRELYEPKTQFADRKVYHGVIVNPASHTKFLTDLRSPGAARGLLPPSTPSPGVVIRSAAHFP